MQFRLILIAFWLVVVSSSYGQFVFFDPEVPEQVPATISATGMYDNIPAKTVNAALIFYDVNTPYWVDGVHKKRWVALPAGTSIPYDPMEDYPNYPTGAVFVKNMYLDTVPGDPSTALLVETRFLVHKKTANPDWYAFSYRWLPDGSDALLLESAGAKDTLMIYPNGIGAAGEPFKYLFPARNVCTACHITLTNQDNHGRTIGGFFAAQLNGSFAHTEDQLTHLFTQGVFTAQNPLPDFTTHPKWAPITDASTSIDIRSRAYIASNCSGCHGTRGNDVGAVFGPILDYDYFKNEIVWEMRDHQLTYDFGIQGSALIRPGNPELSILIYRQKQRNFELDKWYSHAEQMPPVQTFRVDSVAMDTLSKWVTDMCSKVDCPLADVDDSVIEPVKLTRPYFSGGGLHFPQSATDLADQVTLVNTRGVKINFVRIGVREYWPQSAIPAPGIYFMNTGTRNFQLLLQ